jgi:hypothetical protein
MGAGELCLQDWFVPVLYQRSMTRAAARLPEAARHTGRWAAINGHLPKSPPHKFHGRSQALLALERLLHASVWWSWVLAAMARPRWLSSWRVGWCAADVISALCSLEATDAAVLDSLGRQLLPEGDKYSVAQYCDLKAALQPVQRALRDQPTLLVLDNMESVLPDASGKLPDGVAPISELLGLWVVFQIY